MFAEMQDHTEDVKTNIRKSLSKPEGVTTFERYHHGGAWQKIAKHPVFENTTLGVIVLNAVWMSIDTDWNKAHTLPEANAIFQIVEHMFCTYFSVELFVRFMAFRNKCDGFKDAWFVFDSFLVVMMVSETWLLLIFAALLNVEAKFPLGNASVLRLLRLLRLSRLVRMLRSLPELLILIKAMLIAMTSVSYVMVLLTIVTYVFAIACTQLSADTEMGHTYFHNVPLSMYSLICYATFFDNLASFTDAIRAENLFVLFVVFLFICIASLTLMNMLLGVLCEVISDVAKEEVETMHKAIITEKMMSVAEALDTNENGRISAQEFSEVFRNADAMRALESFGVDPEGCVDIVSPLFYREDGTEIDLPFEDFMESILELHHENTATMSDIKFLWSHIMPRLDHLVSSVNAIKERVKRIDEKMLDLLAYVRALARDY